MHTSGMPSRTAVSSSAMAMWKPPSPVPSTGMRPGCARPAPMAVYRPSPMDWKAWVKQKPNSSGTERNWLG